MGYVSRIVQELTQLIHAGATSAELTDHIGHTRMSAYRAIAKARNRAAIEQERAARVATRTERRAERDAREATRTERQAERDARRKTRYQRSHAGRRARRLENAKALPALIEQGHTVVSAAKLLNTTRNLLYVGLRELQDIQNDPLLK